MTDRSAHPRIVRFAVATIPALLCAMGLFTSPGATAAERRDPAQRKDGILTSAAELASLPTSGRAWDNLLAHAALAVSAPDLGNQDDPSNVRVLAKALVYARTGQQRYRAEAVAAILACIGTQDGGRTLALGRELGAYVLAADLVGLDAADDGRFRAFVAAVIDQRLDGRSGIETLRASALHDPSNWGCHARATLVAAARYLSDEALLDQLATRLHDWSGRSGAGFAFKELWWQGDPSAPVGINRAGTVVSGRVLDGVLPDDQRRAGAFDPAQPFPRENYVWEALQGTMTAALLLHRAGYVDVFAWQDEALRRAHVWLHDQCGFPAAADDAWVPHIANRFYGTGFPAPAGAAPGKGLGFTDWLYGSTPTPPANPPIAHAGDDASVTDGDGDGSQAVALDGSRSSDDGAIVAWLWSRDGVGLARDARASVVLPVGRHVIALTVTDDAGASASDTVVVTVVARPTFAAAIDFQPARSVAADGYVPDSGATFRAQNGLSYGWNVRHPTARERDLLADQRLDTHVEMDRSSSRWEIAVPNGTYAVTIACGDPASTSTVNSLLVEGLQVADPDGRDRLDVHELIVPVRDGRLTIQRGSGARTPRLCFIDIATMPVGNG
ncbi:MAG TPA: PKD domain-containing protein [Planctomycetota bacterium]|nr:PKD domain-containing protein [Planctomycetota bacterium]